MRVPNVYKFVGFSGNFGFNILGDVDVEAKALGVFFVVFRKGLK